MSLIESLGETIPRRVRFVCKGYRDNLIVIAVACVSALVELVTWYRGQQLVWGGDGNFPLSLRDVPQYFRVLPPLRQNVDPRALSTSLPWGIVLEALRATGIGWNPSVAQRVVIFALLFSSTYLSYLLIRQVTGVNSLLAIVVGALFYTFNLYSLLTVWSADSFLVFHYCLFPGVVLLWDLGLKRGGCWRIASVIVLWSLAFSPSFITTPVVLTDIVVLGLLMTFRLIVPPTGRSRKAIALSGLTIMIGWILFNLYWIAPTLMYFKSQFASAASQDISLSLNSVRLPLALRLGGYWGLESGFLGSPYFSWSGYYRGITAVCGYIAPLLFALGGLYPFNFQSSIIPGTSQEKVLLKSIRTADGEADLTLFFLIGVFFLLMSLGTHSPGQISIRLLFLFHVGPEFRSIYQRFMAYVPLGYSPFITIGVYRIGCSLGMFAENKGGFELGKKLALIMPSILTLLLLDVIAAWPMWSGQIFNASGVFPSNRITIPASYYSAAHAIDRLGTDVPIMVFPMSSNPGEILAWNSGKNGFVGNSVLGYLTGDPVVILDRTNSQFGDEINQVVQGSSSACNILKSLGVSSVVLDGNADLTIIDAEPGWIGSDTNALVHRLKDLPCLTKPRKFGKISEFFVRGYRANGVFVVSQKNGATNQLNPMLAPESNVSYRQSALGYSVTVPASKRNGYLVLNQFFDPNWRIGSLKPINFGGLTAFRLIDIHERSAEISVVSRSQLVYLVFFYFSCGVILTLGIRSVLIRLKGKHFLDNLKLVWAKVGL